MIKDKDIETFRIMADGATTVNCIHCIQSPSKPIGVVRKHVWTLKNDGFILSKRYTNRNKRGIIALYVLEMKAAEEVCRVLGYRIEEIRMQLPYSDFVTHDREVTNVVRAIRCEAARLNLVVDLADEYYLRCTPKGFPSKMPLPDLYVRYPSNLGDSDDYDLEIDNATTPTRRLFTKITGLPHRTLLLCPTQKRISDVIAAFNQILKVLKNTTNKVAVNINSKLYLAEIADFKKGGVYGTIWTTITGTQTLIFRRINSC